MDALQICVRGFQSSTAGTQIIDALQELGFDIKEAFDGSVDSRGGIIETHIMPTSNLETDDLDEIRESVAVTDETFIQYRHYKLRDDGEIHPNDLAATLPFAVVSDDD